MTFETSDMVVRWTEVHDLNCKSRASAGEHYLYQFIPSGIVMVQTVRCLVCGKEFTVYED